MSCDSKGKMAKIEWDMSDPDMAEDFRRCMKATDLCGAIFEFQQYLRFKHIEKEPTPDEIRDKFYEILDDHAINIDSIYS